MLPRKKRIKIVTLGFIASLVHHQALRLVAAHDIQASNCCNFISEYIGAVLLLTTQCWWRFQNIFNFFFAKLKKKFRWYLTFRSLCKKQLRLSENWKVSLRRFQAIMSRKWTKVHMSVSAKPGCAQFSLLVRKVIGISSIFSIIWQHVGLSCKTVATRASMPEPYYGTRRRMPLLISLPTSGLCMWSWGVRNWQSKHYMQSYWAYRLRCNKRVAGRRAHGQFQQKYEMLETR